MRILVVGDTHGNAQWWADVVAPAAAEVDAGAVIQVGDFGFSGGLGDPICAAAANTGIPVYFLDGNHENHPLLISTVAAARTAAAVTDRTAPVPLVGDLWYLPRGARLRIDGVTLCALGGAVSIDSGFRTAGVNWFPEERITEDDLDVVTSGGSADVLLCHDTPAGYRVPGTLPERVMPLAWRSRLASCEAHRDLVTAALEATGAHTVIHGHYHSRYTRRLDTLWGEVLIEGLDCDGTDGALAVLTCSAGIATVAALDD